VEANEAGPWPDVLEGELEFLRRAIVQRTAEPFDPAQQSGPSSAFFAVLNIRVLSIWLSLRPQRPHAYNLGWPIRFVDSGN
jgi:hypothetical protein